MFACYMCGEEHPRHDPDRPEGENFITVYEGHNYGEDCKAILICARCLDERDFDMWTDEREWGSHDPKVPYDKLPPFDHDDPHRGDPTRYPTLASLV